MSPFIPVRVLDLFEVEQNAKNCSGETTTVRADRPVAMPPWFVDITPGTKILPVLNIRNAEVV